jgi:hypothetical protein
MTRCLTCHHWAQHYNLNPKDEGYDPDSSDILKCASCPRGRCYCKGRTQKIGITKP